MAGLMSSPPESPAAPSVKRPSATPAVAAVVVASSTSTVDQALAAIGRQVYAPVQVLVVGKAPDGVESVTRLDEVAGALGEGIRFVWWLHGDARPRPDALTALMRELARNDASVAGSKILTDEGALESVGSATDVFGEPFTGLDPGELDLEQYDVVREVAFVSAVSLLVRRDLARGLGGFDPRLPGLAAGLDFSQRARLAGGRVIVVPSSEVFHSSPCPEDGAGWKEEGGRNKAMLVAYRPLTLGWVVPIGALVGLANGLGQLILGRLRPLLSTVFSWLWTIGQIPSALAIRRRVARTRSVGDEELFRFQVGGSVRIRRTLSELGDRFNRALDEDESGSLAGRARFALRRPSLAWGLVSGLALLLATRGIWFAGAPQVGFSLPPGGIEGLAAAYGGAPNPAGLGGGAVAAPLVGLASLAAAALGRRPILAGALLTLAAAALALTGMARLARRAGSGSRGATIAGWAYLAGATAIAVFATGNWPVLLAAGPLPWALDPVLGTPVPEWRRRFGRLARAGLAAGLTAIAYPPLLVLIPVVAAIWAVAARRTSAVVAGLAVTSLGAGLISPYLAGGNLYDLLDAGSRPVLDDPWLWLGSLAVTLIASTLWSVRSRLPGVWLSAVLIGFGFLISRLSSATAGLSTVGFIAVALGAGILAALAVELALPRLKGVGWLLAGLLLIPAALTLVQGRLGLPADRWTDELEFVSTLSDGDRPDRALLIGPPGSLPGRARSMFGFEYRVAAGGAVTIAQAYLPEMTDADRILGAVIEESLLGAVDLRPGQQLAMLGIEWLVVVPGSTFPVENLDRQVDLARRPLSTELLVYENLVEPGPVQPTSGFDRALRAAGWASGALLLVLVAASIWGRGRPLPPVSETASTRELTAVS